MTSSECLSWALGVGGMSFDTFCTLTPGEFQNTVEASAEAEEQKTRSMWECMRTLAAVCVSPYSRQAVQPQKLVPLPWDKKPQQKKQPAVSKQEGEKAFRNIMERLKEH